MRWTAVVYLAAVFACTSAVPVLAQNDAPQQSVPTADADAVRLDRFDATIAVQNDGALRITETINGEFLVPRHGLFRVIPADYTRGGTRTSIGLTVDRVLRDGASEPFDVFRQEGSKVIKIGNPDRTFDGTFTYQVSYRVERAILFHENQDEVYWNVTGNDWPVHIPSVHARVLVPDTPPADLSVDCYTGGFGSTAQDCEITKTYGEARIDATTFLTISTRFPKGVVPEPTPAERMWTWISNNWDYFTWLIPLLLATGLFRYWWTHGRDPKKLPVVAPAFDPPDNLTASEVGTLIDATVHNRDFAAAIVDLAVRGYVKIHETKEGTVMKKRRYALERMKATDEGVAPFEQEILDALFGAGKDRVKLKKRRNMLVRARNRVNRILYETMAEEGYYVKNPQRIRRSFIVAAIVVGVLGTVVVSALVVERFDRPAAFIGVYASAFLLFGSAFLMPKKTKKGAEAFERARSFRLFLSKAEKYRLQWQEREHIFEKFLPYAIAFDVTDKWANVFDIEDVQEHVGAWYVAADGVGNIGDLGDSLSSFVGTFATASTPKSSGGSGGGSVGGGFGGGGGGSW